MHKTKLQSVSQSKNKAFANCRQILFLMFIFIIQTIQAPFLEAVITSSILDDKENVGPFTEPIKSKDIKAIKSLINAGCDVNNVSKSGYTPLMAAAFKGSIKIMELFISAGADLESYDNQGNTPFMYAFYGDKQREEAVAYLLSLNVNAEIMNSREETPLIMAAVNNHYNSMKLLIKAGVVNLETKGKSGGTALRHAADNQSIEAARLLIQYGADVNTRDDWSFTPLMLAALRNDGTMIRLLIKSGANVNARTTRIIPVNVSEQWMILPKTVDIPIGSTALDIAKQFKKPVAENVLD